MLKLSQIQIIVDKLAGRPAPRFRPDALDEPWRTIYARIQPCDDPAQAEPAIWRATEGLPDRAALVQALIDALPTSPTLRTYPSLYQLAGRLSPIRWLWPHWIPRGFLSLLGASPGAGKSLVALDLARRILHNLPFPDGAPPAGSGPNNVVYVDAEAIPQLQNQRAQAWSMDRRRLYLMLPPETYGSLDLGSEAQQDILIDMIHQLRPPLVVVDSLSSISLKGENNVEDVRAVLRFLGAVAQEYDLGLLLIHHLRKRPKALPSFDLVTADDFRGSGHIIAMARSVLALSIIHDGPEPDPNGPRRLEVIKTNLCAHPPALGLRFDPPDAATLPDGIGAPPEPGAPILTYTDPPRPYHEPTQAEQCAAWLLALLENAGEPLKPKEIVRLAHDAGFTRGALYRARDQLADLIADTEARRHPDNRWTLA